MGRTLQALIFDVDGTLADTERDGHRVAFNRAFAEVGLPWEWSVERYGALLSTGGGKERLLRYIAEDQPTFVPQPEAKTWAAAIHQIKTQHYKHIMQMGLIPLRPGVARFIHAARSQGIRLAIATTSAPANAIALLETAFAPEAPQWFEVIAAGDVVTAKKPAPDIYRYALQALDLAPDCCLAIEDSHQGLMAATQAGLKTVITRSHYTQDEDFAAAALVLDHLGEPEQPFTVFSTPAPTATYLDLPLAEQILTGNLDERA